MGYLGERRINYISVKEVKEREKQEEKEKVLDATISKLKKEIKSKDTEIKTLTQQVSNKTGEIAMLKKENQSITTACVILLAVIFSGIISFVIKKRHFISAVFRHPYAVKVSRLLSKYSDFNGDAKKQVLYLCNYYEKDYKQYIKMNPYIAIMQLIEFSGIKGNEKEKYTGVKNFYVKPKERKINIKFLIIFAVVTVLIIGILIGFTAGKVTTTNHQTQTSETTSKNDDYVYIGKTGNKYHKENCVSLKNKGKKIKLQDAKKQGKEPCKICIGGN